MNVVPLLNKNRPSPLSAACNRLTVRDLQIVIAVSEMGSIRKASMELQIGQSAVTRRIQKLEDALGVSIFERNQAGVRLTAAGWNFSKQARLLLNELKLAIASARTAGAGQCGYLRLGLIASLSRGVLRRLVSEYHSLHPQIELEFTEGDRSELMTLLSHRIIDVVVAAGKPCSKNDDMLLLAEEQIYLAVPDYHPLATRSHVGWTDIEAMPFIVCAEEPGPEISDFILRRITDLGRQAKMHEHRVEREGLMNLVGLGMGVTAVSDHWRGVHYPNVVFVPIEEDGQGETIPFSLTWRPENDNPALRRFLSLAREVAKTAAASSAPLRKLCQSP